MTKEEKILNFDPSAAGVKDSGIYGLPFTAEESEIVLVPVPWEVTTSYGAGASRGPEHILECSLQVDLHHEEWPQLWKAGIHMTDIPEDLLMRSADMKQMAAAIIEQIEDGADPGDSELAGLLSEVNEACEGMNSWVENTCAHWLAKGKTVGLVGGDHSTPLGFLRALAKVHPSFGVLHIDAHMDLRKAYEGFTYSHASIMYNACALPQITSMVQVGIRDYCTQEAEFVQEQKGRISIYTSRKMRSNLYGGMNWREQCRHIISELPQHVYISFDIDGLDPSLCPATGTPVPGGLQFEEAAFLLSELKHSGRKVIGFDLVEVAPDHTDWNGNVGARVLYQLCGVAHG